MTHVDTEKYRQWILFRRIIMTVNRDGMSGAYVSECLNWKENEMLENVNFNPDCSTSHFIFIETSFCSEICVISPYYLLHYSIQINVSHCLIQITGWSHMSQWRTTVLNINKGNKQNSWWMKSKSRLTLLPPLIQFSHLSRYSPFLKWCTAKAYYLMTLQSATIEYEFHILHNNRCAKQRIHSTISRTS